MDGLQLSSFSQASQGVDGDFVEVIRVGPHCVDIITGDVMGKGIAAAMMGAATKMQFSRSIAEQMAANPGSGTLPSPSAIVMAVHKVMTPALQALEAFVTLCYLRIDTERQTITWVGCGHEEPLRVPAYGRTESLANQHPPLGVLDSPSFEQSETPFLRGDALFLCSDGITDAIRPDGQRVGRQRVIDALTRRKRLHSTPAALLHSLRTDLLPPKVRVTDDVTMVIVQRGSPQHGVARVELPVQLQSIRKVREFVITHAEAAGLDEASAGLLAVAMVEVFTNVVRHATGRPDGAPVELLASVQNSGQGPKSTSELVLEMIHLGDEFTPPADPPATDFSAFPEGGFGLEIIRGSSDQVEYAHIEGVNTLRMSKQLIP
jgi:anti-sigma regulatory factor (Ser/Thr protein kinase)